MAVEYSTTSDLLIGDMILGGLDPAKYILEARREIDSKLGFLYKLPLRILNGTASDTSWLALPEHQVLALIQISNKYASGKLILAMAVGQEGTAVHAYGLHLVREATNDLMQVANGVVDLSAELLNGSVIPVNTSTRTPTMLVHDQESLLVGFENTVLRGDYSWSRPGPLP